MTSLAGKGAVSQVDLSFFKPRLELNLAVSKGPCSYKIVGLEVLFASFWNVPVLGKRY